MVGYTPPYRGRTPIAKPVAYALALTAWLANVGRVRICCARDTDNYRVHACVFSVVAFAIPR